ncbi:MAG: hypothetical protein ABEK16_05535 [Candidatus Nanohalobium sp.]
MKRVILISLVLLLIGSTATVTIPDSNELQQFKQVYNNQTDEVPGFVGNIIGGEKVNFRVETNSSNETIGVSFDGVKIANISENGFEDPTLKVWTDQETISTVIESDSKFSTLREQLNKNEIRYKATTIGGKVKVTIFNTLKGLANLLGLGL